MGGRESPRGVLHSGGVDGRSPLRIAVEGLAEARQRAGAGELEAALASLDLGLAALGGHYRRSGLVDASGLRLAVASRQRAEGALGAAFVAMEGVLEDRIAEYEGRRGDAC